MSAMVSILYCADEPLTDEGRRQERCRLDFEGLSLGFRAAPFTAERWLLFRDREGDEIGGERVRGGECVPGRVPDRDGERATGGGGRGHLTSLNATVSGKKGLPALLRCLQ